MIMVSSGWYDHGDNIDQDEVGRVEDDSAQYPNS